MHSIIEIIKTECQFKRNISHTNMVLEKFEIDIFELGKFKFSVFGTFEFFLNETTSIRVNY